MAICIVQRLNAVRWGMTAVLGNPKPRFCHVGGESMALVRITDETTEAELLECMAFMPRAEWAADRETRIDALWAEVLSRRGAAGVC